MSFIYAEDMDAAIDRGCMNKDCKHEDCGTSSMMVKPACHHQSNMQVIVRKGGDMMVRCARCKKVVGLFKLAYRKSGVLSLAE